MDTVDDNEPRPLPKDVPCPPEWFPHWPDPGDGGSRIQDQPSPWAMFYASSEDMGCVCNAPGKTLQFLGYIWGCVEGRCGYWWQAWRCAECGHEYTDGY